MSQIPTPALRVLFMSKMKSMQKTSNLSKPTHHDEWAELEHEIEARLQMIPHHADRRKFRGLIQRIFTLERQALTSATTKAREERDEARAIVRLILPMAKGYASKHRVGNNQAFVESAEEYIATLAHTKEKGL